MNRLKQPSYTRRGFCEPFPVRFFFFAENVDGTSYSGVYLPSYCHVSVVVIVVVVACDNGTCISPGGKASNSDGIVDELDGYQSR